MATTFTGVITLTNIKTGEVQSEGFTASDVALALVTFTSTSNNFVNVLGDSEITDIVLSAAGVDTSQIRLIVNGKDTGWTKLGAGIIVTVNNRIPDSPRVRGGANLQLKQLT